MSQASLNLADESWMFAEVNEKFLLRNKIYAEGYARQRMSYIRKALGLRYISIKTFADFYKMDVWLFFGKK
ncbi:hypothetical protein P1X15_10900 [Runella sp. MFBS21]|uniref:hypothetical protein n=1 Tax=Runella TaxID=105 RepID=UPI00048D6D3C|nr:MULTISPECIES: hypothetical protein [Runella]MDF7818108.1 hypothetical protein [Runella sp. MFBS21]